MAWSVCTSLCSMMDSILFSLFHRADVSILWALHSMQRMHWFMMALKLRLINMPSALVNSWFICFRKHLIIYHIYPVPFMLVVSMRYVRSRFYIGIKTLHSRISITGTLCTRTHRTRAALYRYLKNYLIRIKSNCLIRIMSYSNNRFNSVENILCTIHKTVSCA